MLERSASPTPLLAVARSSFSEESPDPSPRTINTTIIKHAHRKPSPSLKLVLMFTIAALVLVSVLQFSAVMGGVDAVRRKSSSSPSAACLGFSPKASPGVVVAERTYYPANTTVVISNDYLGFGSASLPAFCRLQLLITTNATAGSFAYTEVWLPDKTAWNQRMLTIGGGGVSGRADVAALIAGVSTNGGHNSSAYDGTWGGPHNDARPTFSSTKNAIVDFAWRAVHLSVLAGKDIIQQSHQQAPKRSYYQGCSTGGRQGLKETQLFPTSFDGIVIGSPANWMRLVAWGAHLSKLIGPATASHFIPAATWTGVIAPEVMKQCDALDGVTDNVINDPSVCNFRPETLACSPGQDPATCLNADQIAIIPQIYAYYYEDGKFVFTGLNYGGEDVYSTFLLGETPNTLITNWVQYMLLNDTTWTVDQYNSSVYKIGDATNPGHTDAINPDLSAFAARPHNSNHPDGVAPTKILATKFNNDVAADGVAFTRPLCKVRPLIR
ncbi:tannase-domain-containing protein [Trametes versicolor FP-101664 SS1]|uniref:tannase-domain-containing protein n=1 Tax=Trametes versicolor (strain FP-101664) TaxID=717944 RepID=UPI0004623614|nr:tannase-domain-containing protein [Trametes versicolor FP-101664 SS1]EIW55287.1 tannase-domain-containing protein [Trametes versicolor FP-101664 SS1]